MDDPPKWARRALQEVLRPTYWFDTGEGPGEPYSLTISFTGRRLGSKGKGRARPGDEFVCEQTVDGIVPGSGPAAVTAEVAGVPPGNWKVTAARLARAGDGGNGRGRPPALELSPDGAARSLWPRRVVPRAAHSSTLKTAARPFAPIPGVHQLAWGPLVILGVLVGLAVQALLLAGAGYAAGPALLASVAPVLAGWAGAKAWYVAVQRGRRFDGWCIQGAISGGALVLAIVLASGIGVPAGADLNAIAPGLMLGMAVGRPGCFLAGCCYGRPTASRWGIWSSDRCLGIRRIPTQLIEALLCLAIGLVALALVLAAGLGTSGALLLGALAAYVLGRQFILPLRAEPRQTALGRPLVIGLSALALAAAALSAVV